VFSQEKKRIFKKLQCNSTLKIPVEPSTTACDSRPGLGRIQGGSQGNILNFHILVQCKYVVSFKL
jgi:hypothetical protein